MSDRIQGIIRRAFAIHYQTFATISPHHTLQWTDPLYHLWGGVGWGRPPQFDHNIHFLSQVHQIKILEFYPTAFWGQFLLSIYRGLKNLSRNLTTPCIECWAHSTYFMLKTLDMPDHPCQWSCNIMSKPFGHLQIVSTKLPFW